MILYLFIVPRPVSGTDSNIKKFNQMTATVSYNIPVIPYYVIIMIFILIII